MHLSPRLASPFQTFNDKTKPAMMRNSNIIAAKALADLVRTSLGPKGMDKMVCSSF
jgi:T-complex protein 1 subunit delta